MSFSNGLGELGLGELGRDPFKLVTRAVCLCNRVVSGFTLSRLSCLYRHVLG